MSVAFRRESDEEHKEPKFEIPLPLGPNLVTATGLSQIHARVRHLEEQVASHEDEAVREEWQRDLRYWRTRQATAQLAPEAAGDEVAFGTEVKFLLNGEERAMSIVGDDEADPGSGFISFRAPLAKALLGGGVGDQLPFAGVDDAIEILEIGPL